ncbi:MAG: TetR/AcrR family transcriptional regulator [Solirubrobacteraceae bacterium]|nr:TetR/AcrR family transcriptional regulator [Solirubrobacteraceae bacterium]
MAENRRHKPRQARSRDMIERLIDATARVLERDGYAAASTNAVAREAGASPGSLYRYFADKDELLVAVTARFVGGFGERLEPAVRHAALQAEPADAIRTVMDAALAALEDQAGLLRALLENVPPVDQAAAVHGIRTRLAGFVFQALAVRRGALVHDDVERITWNMVELAQHLPVRYVLDAPPISREDFLDDLVRTLMVQAFPVAA